MITQARVLTETVAGGWITDPMLLSLGTGLVLVAGGLIYIVRERRKKMQEFGI